jgi:hypothetical protein
MDLIIPNTLNDKMIEPNVFLKEIKEKTEQWVSKYLMKKWTDDKDLVDCAMYFYRQECDFNKLLLVSKWHIWSFGIDDEIDKNPDSANCYIDYYKGNVNEENDSSLPYTLMKIIDTEFKQLMSPKLYEFYTEQSIKLILALQSVARITSGDKIVSSDEFYPLRKYDTGLLFVFIFGVFLYDVDESIIDDDFENNPINELFIIQLWMINDIYSFKREYLRQTSNFNYVTILSKENDVTLQDAVYLLINKIKDNEVGINRLKNNTVESGSKYWLKYFEILELLCDGFLKWNHIANRYINI